MRKRYESKYLFLDVGGLKFQPSVNAAGQKVGAFETDDPEQQRIIEGSMSFPQLRVIVGDPGEMTIKEILEELGARGVEVPDKVDGKPPTKKTLAELLQTARQG